MSDDASHSGTRQRSDALFALLEDDDSLTRQKARGELIELHLPLVEHCARRFRNRGEPQDDLVQVGTIGLIKAVDRFEPTRGIAFSTYATPTIVGEIKRHFRDKGWAIRVPRRLQELRLAITAANAELTQELGRSPTASDVAERIDAELEEVLEAMESANAYATLSFDAPDSDPEGRTILDLLGAADDGHHLVELRESLRPLLDSLPDREREIITLRFFDELTQSQIAEKVGISQMHVSRLLTRTLAHLRDQLA